MDYRYDVMNCRTPKENFAEGVSEPPALNYRIGKPAWKIAKLFGKSYGRPGTERISQLLAIYHTGAINDYYNIRRRKNSIATE